MAKEKNFKKNFSFDDLEIEKLKKEELSKVPSLKKVKDDFDITYKQKPKEKILEEKPAEKKSLITRIFKKISLKWSEFTNSKIGKILFSNSLSYAVSLACAAVAVSGLFTPISPLIIATAGITAMGVGIQAVNETIKIHNLRRLHKESNLLVQNRNAKAKQNYILSLEPSLNKILENELVKIPEKEKKLNIDKYQVNSKNFKSLGIVLANNVGGLTSSISSAIVQGASGNVLGILKATSYGVLTSVSLITGGLSEKEKIGIKSIFKLSINEEWKKKDTPNYQNLEQLENYTKKQTLQTLALKKLITDKDYWSMKDEDKRQKFKEIKNNFEKGIEEKGFKAFFAENKIIVDDKKENYLKDFGKVMDPLYEKPSKAKEYSHLARAMNKKVKSANRSITH